MEPITVFLDDPKFPNTTLGEDEWENAETLANWISIDIFGNYVGKEAVLTDQEKNVLDIVAVEFFGSEEAFDRFMNGTAYNEAEQKELDAAVRSFLERYPVRDDPKLQIQPFDELAELDFMPYTTLTRTQWEQVEEILDHRLPDNIWRRKYPDYEGEDDFKDADGNPIEYPDLTKGQSKAVDTVFTELFGEASIYNRWARQSSDLTGE